jgi:hypothetical protein
MAHGFGSNAKKVFTIQHTAICLPQFQVSLIDHDGCLQRRTAATASELAMGQAPQVGVKQSDQFIVGRAVTVTVRFD